MNQINTKNIPIEWEVDVVYIWCDSSNPEYIKNRAEYSEQYNLNSYWSPTRDHWEITHSIMSIRKNMSWVRDIIICSPKEHRVKGLDIKKYNVRYVDNEVILWEENCPNFNSHSLELFTHKIPWLSEYYIQFMDDFFVNNTIELDDFYNSKTQKIKYYYENVLILWKPFSPMTSRIIYAMTWEKKYFWATHSPKMFFKQDIKDIVIWFKESAKYTKETKFRTKEDLQLVYLYGYYLNQKQSWEFIFVNNTLPKERKTHLLQIIFWKLWNEGLYETIGQIYLQWWYKKKLSQNKTFSDDSIYSLIQVKNDYEKNKINIDFAFEKKVKFICLNDSYDSEDSETLRKIKKNFQYFYKKLLHSWKK